MKHKKVIFRYLQTPEKVDGEKIVLRKNYLEGEPFKQTSKASEKTSTVSYDMLVVSVGFEVSSLFSNNYDSEKKKVSNSDGCVIKIDEKKIDIGSYAVGWCKNGPKGVIDETLLSCEETFNNLRIHLDNNLLR